MEIELNAPETEITGKDISVETGNINIAVSEDTKDLDITYNRKEYSIIGDDIFISSVLDDVPEWLGDLIDSTFEAAILSRDQNLINRMEAILTALDYVPKNRYTEQINQIVDEDGIINTRIATLNSNLTDALTTANATIAEINLTYASKNEAAAIATNVLTASLSSDGEIGSTLINLQNAYADLESTTAESITLLESVMEGEINGNASAMQTVRSYVGIDEAGASTGTGLSAYLEDSNGVIGGADSQLNNTIKVTAEGVESKFAYNSIVNINGVYKKSGFGLTTNYTSGSGTKDSPYVSEFWIDASRLKFTNSNQTGKASPFTIDATGTTPKITFNGLVTFGSGQSGTIDEAIAAVVETVSVGDKNINITDNLIPVTSFVADTDNSGYQLIGNPVKSISAGYDNYSEAQLSMDSNDEAYSPYVDEMNSSYYYRFAIKGITSLNNFKIATISAANAVTYSVVTVTMNSGQTLSSTSWYLVDGLINPYGGNTSADGSIRNSSGTKIGTINNFVLPSSANKMVLGWQGTAIISRMKLCTVTADTIMSDFTSVNATLVANQTQIDASTQLLADMANDNKLTPSEKSEALKEWTRIQSEKTLNTTQAATYSVTSTAYTTAYSSLSSYVTPILSSMSTTSDIVGTTFRSTFKSYYDENTKILNAIATKISANATTYTDEAKAAALLAASDAQTTANTAVINAATANSLLADIASDSKLTPDEKISTKKEWDILVSEYSKNTAQATTYSVSSTAYTTAYNALNIYLTPLLSSLTDTSVIVGTTFRSNFKAYYDARTDLLNAIATKINANAQSYANSAVSNIAWQSEVQTAINNNATTTDGGKIVTNEAFVNNLNAVGGVVADYVNANEINGLVINGGIINGARINGAVIKASYLDLDGELEVLTNYRISVATYNANPSLYSDAVYISADNEYRIPSLSTTREANKSVALHSVGASSTSLNRSYNTANVGHNNKCVGISPTLNYVGTVLTITVNTAVRSIYGGDFDIKHHSYETSLYFFGSLVGKFKIVATAYNSFDVDTNTRYSGVYSQLYVNGSMVSSFSISIRGVTFSASLTQPASQGGISTLNINMSSPNVNVGNYTSGHILQATTNTLATKSGTSDSSTLSSSSYFKTSSGFTINNMI